MNTEFRFNGSIYRLVLSPTSGEEKQLAQLFFNGRNELKLIAMGDEKSYIIESNIFTPKIGVKQEQVEETVLDCSFGIK